MTACRITAILDAAGVAYTVTHSTAWSDRHGPSESAYVKFDGLTVRVSAHRYTDDAWADTARDGLASVVKRVAERVGQAVPTWASAQIAAEAEARAAAEAAKKIADADLKARIKSLRREIAAISGPIPASIWQEAVEVGYGHLCPKNRRAA